MSNFMKYWSNSQAEYGVRFCSPHYRKGTIELERMQRRDTVVFPALEGFHYKEKGYERAV